MNWQSQLVLHYNRHFWVVDMIAKQPQKSTSCRLPCSIFAGYIFFNLIKRNIVTFLCVPSDITRVKSGGITIGIC